MAGDKINMSFEINTDSKLFLESMTEKYGLPDTSKAIRCLLDYAANDGDADEIFKKIRCNRCGWVRELEFRIGRFADLISILTDNFPDLVCSVAMAV